MESCVIPPLALEHRTSPLAAERGEDIGRVTSDSVVRSRQTGLSHVYSALYQEGGFLWEQLFSAPHLGPEGEDVVEGRVASGDPAY